jgi:hypothetical protein
VGGVALKIWPGAEARREVDTWGDVVVNEAGGASAGKTMMALVLKGELRVAVL